MNLITSGNRYIDFLLATFEEVNFQRGQTIACQLSLLLFLTTCTVSIFWRICFLGQFFMLAGVQDLMCGLQRVA